MLEKCTNAAVTKTLFSYQMASRRCHDEGGNQCLMPQVGSPPDLENNHGVGYYTIQDYQNILRYAKARHIQVRKK